MEVALAEAVLVAAGADTEEQVVVVVMLVVMVADAEDYSVSTFSHGYWMCLV